MTQYHLPATLPPGDQGPDLEFFSLGEEGFLAAEADIVRDDVLRG